MILSILEDTTEKIRLEKAQRTQDSKQQDGTVIPVPVLPPRQHSIHCLMDFPRSHHRGIFETVFEGFPRKISCFGCEIRKVH